MKVFDIKRYPNDLLESNGLSKEDPINGNDNLCKVIQPDKRAFPILDTLLGITIEVKLLQSEKAESEIFFRPSAIFCG